MRNLFILAGALEIIEENLKEPIKVDDVAKMCHCSISGVQKLFKYAFGCWAGEYITKRRLSLAARELVSTEKSVTEIAFSYQYNSPEAFSRAFSRFWGANPSVFRREFKNKRRIAELFPKFELSSENGGYVMSKQRKVDISQLYDELLKLRGTYVLCADMCNLMLTNEKYGHAAGDIALAETAKRIEREIGEDMFLFRVGADEFAAVTGLEAAKEAEELAKRIIAKNGEAFMSNGSEIPLSMRIAAVKIPDGVLSYREMLENIHGAISRVKECGGYFI